MRDGYNPEILDDLGTLHKFFAAAGDCWYTSTIVCSGGFCFYYFSDIGAGALPNDKFLRGIIVMPK